MSNSQRQKRPSNAFSPTGRRQKQRRTFTLSPESVALLEELSVNAKSTSAFLDELLLSLRTERKRQEMEERIGRYYDHRTDEGRREERLWAEFALKEFAAAELAKLRSN